MRLRIVGAALLVASVGMAVMDAESGLPAWHELGQDLAVSRVRVNELTKKNAGIRRQIDALERIPFATEQAIREELELARDGEVVVYFEGGTPLDRRRSR